MRPPARAGLRPPKSRLGERSAAPRSRRGCFGGARPVVGAGVGPVGPGAAVGVGGACPGLSPPAPHRFPPLSRAGGCLRVGTAAVPCRAAARAAKGGAGDGEGGALSAAAAVVVVFPERPTAGGTSERAASSRGRLRAGVRPLPSAAPAAASAAEAASRALPAVGARVPSGLRPQIRRGDPLNLSILVSGGKETNEDSLSNGE
ncbi:uncharacterized protein ACIB01_001459 [Guaruba guarouba]